MLITFLAVVFEVSLQFGSTKLYSFHFLRPCYTAGRDSSVGIATRCRLVGPVIDSRWGGRDFPHPSRPALGPTKPPVQLVLGLALTTHLRLAPRLKEE
jgi:hypothetical protein